MTDIMDDSSTPSTNGICHFFQLPRELRDEIYELAYSQHDDCEIYFEEGYSAKRRAAYRAKEMKRSSMPHINHFLVSKEWYAEAFPIFLQHNTFKCQSSEDFMRILQSSIAKRHIRSLILHTTYMPPEDLSNGDRTGVAWNDDEFTKDSYDWQLQPVAGALSECSKLAKLEVHLDFTAHLNWNVLEGGPDWKGVWAGYVGMQYESLVEDLKAVRGLCTFDMHHLLQEYVKEESGEWWEEQWENESQHDETSRFVRKVEAEIREEVVKTKS